MPAPVPPPSHPAPPSAASRRAFMRMGAGALIGAYAIPALRRSAFAQSTGHAAPDALREALDPMQALARLREGNARYAEYHSRHPDETRERRLEICQGQHPFAAVLGCVDSRVPPELVFDQGLGDLFTVRSAGHVLDDVELGSLEFGIEELDVPLLVVLAHQRCGAVRAAVAAADGRIRPHGHVVTLVNAIAPAVAETRGMPGSHPELAARAHLARTVSTLRAVPALAERCREGRLLIVGAYYTLDTGVVEFDLPTIA